MPKHKAKSKISNIKRRKIEKKNRSRDNAFGFTKTRKVKEYEGVVSDEESDTNLPPHHDQEVIVVSNDTFAHQPKPKSFHQLSQVSMTHVVSSTDTSLNEPDLGFFMDATPATIPPKRSRKILKDDSIYIESEDEDDGISISSSEDIEILQALSHWGSNTDLQFDQSVKVKGRSDIDDFALLQNTLMDDICASSEEEEQEIDMIEDDIDNVPDSLKHSYRMMVKQEKLEWKRQKNKKNKKKETVSTAHLLDQILQDFINQDQVQNYSLAHLTHHGRTMIVPILAKLFQLEITAMDTSQKHIVLTKTVNTRIPSSYTDYIESTQKRKKKKKNEFHGQQVASDSAPIPSSNIGHRMLSAMGWKEGEAISKDGIKEPVKVFMRANRRGLGA